MNVLFVLSVVWPVVGLLIGRSKGRTIVGLLLGVFLGPFGILIVSLLRDVSPTWQPPNVSSSALPGWRVDE